MTATAPHYDRTVVACFNGYVTQAIINNFMPLLFVTFSATLGIDMARLSMLISVNFVTQFVVDGWPASMWTASAIGPASSPRMWPRRPVC